MLYSLSIYTCTIILGLLYGFSLTKTAHSPLNFMLTSTLRVIVCAALLFFFLNSTQKHFILIPILFVVTTASVLYRTVKTQN